MWSTLEKLSEQITKYCSFLGKLWYVFVFLFRLIVVAAVGNAVYSDEQSAFTCSQDLVGCTKMCYNQFAKISHMRFWAFQLLAVATPTVFFHFYSTHISGEIEKLKASEFNLRQLEESNSGRLTLGTSMSEGDMLKMSRRMRSIGRVKVRRVYSKSELKEVPYTNKIKRAYYVTILLRIIIEGIFLYLGYMLFRYPNPKCHGSSGCFPSRNFLWMSIPGTYYCGALTEGVRSACKQHFREGNMDDFVPCFVSRPFEKTVFLRYMMILSGLCLFISVMELVAVAVKQIKKKRLAGSCRKKSLQHLIPPTNPDYRPTSSFPPKIFEESNFYPNVAMAMDDKDSQKSSKSKGPVKCDEDKDSMSVGASAKNYV